MHKYYTKIKNSRIFKIVSVIIAVCVFFAVLYNIVFSADAITWNKGDEQSYFFEMKSTVKTIDFAKGVPGYTKSEISGILNFKIYEVGEQIKTGFQLEIESLEIDGIDKSKLEKLYEIPFYVVFSKEGEPLRFYFERSVSVQDQKFFEQVMYLLQYNVEEGSIRWSVEEKDVSGECISSYRNGFSNVVKNRIRSANQAADQSVAILDSRFRYSFNDVWSWLYGVNVFEVAKIRNSMLQVTTEISLKIVGREKLNSENSVLRNDPRNFEQIVKDSTTSDRRISSVWDEERLEALKNTIKPNSFDQIINEMVSGSLPEFDFVDKIADYFRLYPQEISIIASRIIAGQFNSKLVDYIMYAMGKVGTKDAQVSLVNIASSGQVDHNLRMKAAVYLGNVQSPDPGIVPIVTAYAIDYSHKDSAILSSALICSLGRMVSTDQKNGQFSQDVKTFLHSRLENDNINISERCSLINSISNTGDSDFYEIVEDQKSSNSPFVRAAALNALTELDAERSEKTIADAIRNDSDPFVRKSAVLAQLDKTANDEIIDAVTGRFLSEKDYEAKHAMIEYLGKNRDADSSVKRALESALQSETDPRIRVMLHKALLSEKK